MFPSSSPGLSGVQCYQCINRGEYIFVDKLRRVGCDADYCHLNAEQNVRVLFFNSHIHFFHQSLPDRIRRRPSGSRPRTADRLRASRRKSASSRHSIAACTSAVVETSSSSASCAGRDADARAGEAAPRTDEACTAPLPGASLPGAPPPVAASSLHAGNHFRKLGSIVKIDAARDIWRLLPGSCRVPCPAVGRSRPESAICVVSIRDARGRLWQKYRMLPSRGRSHDVSRDGLISGSLRWTLDCRGQRPLPDHDHPCHHRPYIHGASARDPRGIARASALPSTPSSKPHLQRRAGRQVHEQHDPSRIPADRRCRSRWPRAGLRTASAGWSAGRPPDPHPGMSDLRPARSGAAPTGDARRRRRKGHVAGRTATMEVARTLRPRSSMK